MKKVKIMALQVVTGLRRRLLSGFNGASEASCSRTSAALQAARVAARGDDASFPEDPDRRAEVAQLASAPCRAVPCRAAGLTDEVRKETRRPRSISPPPCAPPSTRARSSVDADAGRAAPTVRLRAKLLRRSIQRDGRKNSAPELPVRHIPQAKCLNSQRLPPQHPLKKSGYIPISRWNNRVCFGLFFSVTRRK